MVMVFMADTDMVDTDMVDTAVDTDTDTTLARDPLMLMPKPAQLCSMVPMDSPNCTSVKPKLMLPQTHTTAMPDTVMAMVMDTHTHTDMADMADTDTVKAVN